jgi:hypothetical protein
MRWPHTLLLGASLDSQELGIVAGGFVQLLPTRSRQQDSEVLAWILSIAREVGDPTTALYGYRAIRCVCARGGHRCRSLAGLGTLLLLQAGRGAGGLRLVRLWGGCGLWSSAKG